MLIIESRLKIANNKKQIAKLIIKTNINITNK